MKDLNKIKQEKFFRRQRRTRAQITGTTSKPRLSVFRSLLHISAQAIDDVGKKTLVAASDKEIKAKGNKSEIAALVGELLGKKLTEKKISKIIFDKGAYKYHGRVKALADGLRKSGINF
ncbi:50S ribosomal protein L18 [Candidatus Parcubacteria bacterium]|jgi:large subunit ribosomal protein L18|nr:50S ribosomal protein L18 [Candidatus Parcubacteria bacterium]